MTQSNNHFNFWFMNEAAFSPDAYHDQGGRVLDHFEMKDCRVMWAIFYGEGPRESIYKGTEGKILTGHIHLESPTEYESYLPTVEGEVIRVVTMSETGDLKEPPRIIDTEESIALIAFLVEQIH